MNYFSGNSAFGYTLVRKELHKDIKYYHEGDVKIAKLINSTSFNHLQHMGDREVVEIETDKSRIKIDTPVHIGFFVLEYAKLMLLRFYYDFLTKYLPFDSFCLVEADTDSMYLGIAEPTIFQAVKPELRAEFIEEYQNWFAVVCCSVHKLDFFTAMFEGKPWNPCSKCTEVKQFDKRTLGKFHLEWEGNEIIALCSKCYR